MKLAVSNIAWEPTELKRHLKLLRELGCSGIEIAPTLIWPDPLTVSIAEIKELQELVLDNDIEIVGFHALLYNRPDLTLFKDREGFENTLAYIKGLIPLCSELGGEVLVFGSPRNRARNGRDIDECKKISIEFFYKAAEEAKRQNVFICIEPLDESNFITSSQEGREFVYMVNHPHFMLHLDIKAMINNNEDFDEAFLRCKDILRHIHVGDPGLLPPGTTGFDHQIPAMALKNSGYNRYISIEMRRGFGPSEDVVTESVKYVKARYMKEMY